MQNNTEMGCILLNAGPRTRTPFLAGIGDLPCRSYRTKELLLHLPGDGSAVFLNANAPIDLKAQYVFIRLRSTDAHFCGMLVRYLKHHQIPTNDPIHLVHPRSAEKISQMMMLSLANVRIPDTYVFREESFTANYEYLKKTLAFPLIYKLDGSKGRKVQLIHSFEELETAVASKPRCQLAIVQQFISNTFDTRTLIFEKEVLGTISRTRKEGYLNNVALGAAAALFELTDTEKETALRAAEVCGIDFAGVDMIHTAEGPVVLEINKSPQVTGFESVHPFRVFTRIAERIREKYC